MLLMLCLLVYWVAAHGSHRTSKWRAATAAWRSYQIEDAEQAERDQQQRARAE
jgi:hypothetical protein